MQIWSFPNYAVLPQLLFLKRTHTQAANHLRLLCDTTPPPYTERLHVNIKHKFRLRVGAVLTYGSSQVSFVVCHHMC